MDKDLIAYLDERFRENAQQLASFREEANNRLEETNRRIERVEEGVRHTQVMVEDFREETNRHIDEAGLRTERVEEGVRHTQIMVEGMRGDIRLLAEGVVGYNEKLAAVRSELREEIGEVKTLLHLSYGDLNRRIG